MCEAMGKKASCTALSRRVQGVLYLENASRKRKYDEYFSSTPPTRGPIVDSHILSNIRRLKSELADIIEPDFGLLDQLLSREVLTRRQYDDIRSERRAAYRRSEAVLDLLVSQDQCDKFIVALQRTDQQHIVNFVKQNGGQTHCDINVFCTVDSIVVF